MNTVDTLYVNKLPVHLVQSCFGYACMHTLKVYMTFISKRVIFKTNIGPSVLLEGEGERESACARACTCGGYMWYATSMGPNSDKVLGSFQFIKSFQLHTLWS